TDDRGLDGRIGTENDIGGTFPGNGAGKGAAPVGVVARPCKRHAAAVAWAVQQTDDALGSKARGVVLRAAVFAGGVIEGGGPPGDAMPPLVEHVGDDARAQQTPVASI